MPRNQYKTTSRRGRNSYSRHRNGYNSYGGSERYYQGGRYPKQQKRYNGRYQGDNEIDHQAYTGQQRKFEGNGKFKSRRNYKYVINDNERELGKMMDKIWRILEKDEKEVMKNSFDRSELTIIRIQAALSLILERANRLGEEIINEQEQEIERWERIQEKVDKFKRNKEGDNDEDDGDDEENDGGDEENPNGKQEELMDIEEREEKKESQKRNKKGGRKQGAKQTKPADEKESNPEQSKPADENGSNSEQSKPTEGNVSNSESRKEPKMPTFNVKVTKPNNGRMSIIPLDVSQGVEEQIQRIQECTNQAMQQTQQLTRRMSELRCQRNFLDPTPQGGQQIPPNVYQGYQRHQRQGRMPTPCPPRQMRQYPPQQMNPQYYQMNQRVPHGYQQQQMTRMPMNNYPNPMDPQKRGLTQRRRGGQAQ